MLTFTYCSQQTAEQPVALVNIINRCFTFGTTCRSMTIISLLIVDCPHYCRVPFQYGRWPRWCNTKTRELWTASTLCFSTTTRHWGPTPGPVRALTRAAIRTTKGERPIHGKHKHLFARLWGCTFEGRHEKEGRANRDSPPGSGDRAAGETQAGAGEAEPGAEHWEGVQHQSAGQARPEEWPRRQVVE